MSPDEGSSSSALALWPTIKRSYSECLRRFPDVVRAVWFWLLLLLPIFGFADWLRWSLAADIHRRLQTGTLDGASAHYLTIVTGLYSSAIVILTLAYIDVAVQWHRLIILQQRIGRPGQQYMTAAPWKYLGALLVIAFLAIAPLAITLSVALSDLSLGLPIWLDVLLTCLLVSLLATCLAAFVRLSLVLPAQATGNGVFSFLKSCRQCKNLAGFSFLKDDVMRGIALVVVTVCAFATPSLAAPKCPIDDEAAAKAGGFVNAVTAAVKTEFSCEGAFRVLDLCQIGSTADNALSDMVLAKCEPRFLPKAKADTKAAYEKARAKCTKIAAKDGTMYQGQAAVCLARTARDFARKHGTKS